MHFSSESVEWNTPDDLYKKLDREYHFNFDPCASADNAKTKKFLSGPCLVEAGLASGYYYGDCQCGLHASWGMARSVFMNPPYRKRNAAKGHLFGIEDWVRKALHECLVYQNLVVALLPARTDTNWWHDWVSRANERDMLRGRVKFESGGSLQATTWAAPFPSVVAVFEPPSISLIQPFRGSL